MAGALNFSPLTSLPFRRSRHNNLCRASVQMAPPPTAACKTSGSLYDVLRINKNASAVEIKAAYRNLAKVFHPDCTQSESSDGRDFIEIHEAYSTLSDPDTRAVYDLKLAVGSGRRQTGLGYDSGYYRTRRWETDQCW